MSHTHLFNRLRWAFVVLLLACVLGATGVTQPANAANTKNVCDTAGAWVDPKTKAALSTEAIFQRLAKPGIVLLGESHTSLEHHRWQAQTIAGLLSHKRNMSIGVEMLPRAAQPVLDKWSAGQISQKIFLSDSRWADVWGYDAALYMPIFDLARQNRLPMMALNVDRTLVSKTGREGWDTIPEDEREGVSTPAPASAAYQKALAEVFLAKMRHSTPGGSWADKNADTPGLNIDAILDVPGFQRFVAAQLVWDRAMAEALATAYQQAPERLIVGIIGSGHLEYGFGVPHQLAKLGVQDTTILLPIDTGDACQELDAEIADTVFLVDRTHEPDGTTTGSPKPRLGVAIEGSDEGVRVMQVADGSIAETAQLKSGDIITHAAGLNVQQNPELIQIIQRQAPGTWLPLTISRDGKTIDLIAKFPAEE